ncbi:MAG: hypothetical protein HFJ52_01620 [Clostridia bacterium]|nr:hypothetical protein [Clostridia bacterium]
MKNTHKRFLSLVMAMMMLLACMVTASACPTSPIEYTSSIVSMSVSPSSAREMRSLTLPLTQKHVSTGETWEGNLGDTKGCSYITFIKTASTPACTVTVNRSGHTFTKYISASNTRVTICAIHPSEFYRCSYTIRFEGDGPAGCQFFGTDFSYNE